MLWLLIFIVVALVPFVCLPMYKSMIFHIIAVISVILTICLLIYLYVNRVNVYYFQLLVKNIPGLERFETMDWDKKNEGLLEALEKEGYYVKNWVMNSSKKGVKIFLLKGTLTGSEENYIYHRDIAEEGLKIVAGDGREEPVLAPPLLKVNWSKEKSTKILKEIKRTHFSSMGRNYGVVLGIFDTLTDFKGLFGTEPTSIDGLSGAGSGETTTMAHEKI